MRYSQWKKMVYCCLVHHYALERIWYLLFVPSFVDISRLSIDYCCSLSSSLKVPLCNCCVALSLLLFPSGSGCPVWELQSGVLLWCIELESWSVDGPCPYCRIWFDWVLWPSLFDWSFVVVDNQLDLSVCGVETVLITDPVTPLRCTWSVDCVNQCNQVSLKILDPLLFV